MITFINKKNNTRKKLFYTLVVILVIQLVAYAIRYLTAPVDFEKHWYNYDSGSRRYYLTFDQFIFLSVSITLATLFYLVYSRVIRKIVINKSENIIVVEFIDRFKLEVQQKTEDIRKVGAYIDKWPGKGLETVILKISSESLGTINIVSDDFGSEDFMKLIEEITGKVYKSE